MQADVSQQPFQQQLKAWASQEGFEAFGIALVDDELGDQTRASHLQTYIREGRHGDMDWLARDQDRRSSIKTLWSDAKTIIMLGMNYGTDDKPLEALKLQENGVIATYAKGQDYHDIIKKRLKKIARLIVEETGCQLKVFVDTAPLMEKSWAQKSGLGWQGKHTNLVSRNLGSWLFLGSIVLDFEVRSLEAETDHCGACHACLDICPTKAITAPYQLDGRRCISYLTIEHKGMIDPKLRPLMGNHIYGCDDCLAICPWNKFAKAHNEEKFAVKEWTDNPPLARLLTLDDTDFRTAFARTPIKRTGRNRFIRNCLIAAGNSGDKALVPLIELLLSDESALVRAHAVWALGQLVDADKLVETFENVGTSEQDGDVQKEWKRLGVGHG